MEASQDAGDDSEEEEGSEEEEQKEEDRKMAEDVAEELWAAFSVEDSPDIFLRGEVNTAPLQGLPSAARPKVEGLISASRCTGPGH